MGNFLIGKTKTYLLLRNNLKTVIFLFFCLLQTITFGEEDDEQIKMPTISTDDGVVIFNDKLQARIQSMQYKNNIIECHGETVLWYMNIQISGNNVTIIVDKGKKTIKEIIFEDSYKNKPLLVVFNEIDLPNHFTAKKIRFIFSEDRKYVEKIILNGDVKTFYIILKDNKIEWINKAIYSNLNAFFNKETQRWDIKLNIAKGEMVSGAHAIDNWSNVTLEGFRLYKNDILEKKDYIKNTVLKAIK